MKKTFLVAALLAFAGVASATDISAFTSYDYNRQASTQHHGTTQELSTGVKVNTDIGTFDAEVEGNRYALKGSDNAIGIEAGYTNTVALPLGSLSARFGIGRKTGIGKTGGEYTGNLNYYSLGAEYAVPLNTTVTAFVGARHRGAFSSVSGIENRVSAGADFELTKDVSARVGLTHTVTGADKFNGLTTAVSYSF